MGTQAFGTTLVEEAARLDSHSRISRGWRLGSREQNAMALFHGAHNRNSLIDPHGPEHFLDLRPRIEQDHLKTEAPKRAGARHKHAHSERSDEFQAGDIHESRPASRCRITVEFHI